MKQFQNIAFLICTLLFGVACQPAAQKATDGSAPLSANQHEPAYRDINVKEFNEMGQDPDAVILDVRTPGETAQGVIPGALEIDVNDPAFQQKISKLDTTKTYLVYCRSGRRSAHACEVMSKAGFGKLFNLEGGYLAWSRKQ